MAEMRSGYILQGQAKAVKGVAILTQKKRPAKSGTFQFGVILYQPAAGQAKEKFFFSTNFSGAAGETE